MIVESNMELVASPMHKFGPLRMFYHRKGIPLPEVESLPGREIPQPPRRLLVHHQDMTSQLQSFFQDDLLVDVVRKEARDSIMNREVILRRQSDRLPVEYGAIQIHFSQLPPEAQELVLESRKPLGAILHEYKVGFHSCPGCFFRLTSDVFMEKAFDLDRSYPLYGRCNLLTYSNGKILANVVEILPPVERLQKVEETLA